VKRFVVFGLLCLIGLPAAADVSVRIVDYPTSVLQYSPVFVTGRIENHGSSPVLVPASNSTSNRWFVETGRTAESLSEQRRFDSATTSSELVWLKPGESVFFVEDIGFWLWIDGLGRYFIRAGLQSNGECLYQPRGDEKFPLKVLAKHPGLAFGTYECWSGHELSEIVSIDVVEPDLAVDREALQYLESPDPPGFCCGKSRFDLTLQFGAPYLLERFPTSHYTYVGSFYAGQNTPASLQRLLDLQPNHPLNPYTRMSRALSLINSGRGEEVSFETLDIPSALKDYLVQEKVAQEKREKRAVSQRTPLSKKKAP